MLVPTILIIIFSITACLESISYALYEIFSNNNKIRWNYFNNSFCYCTFYTYYSVFYEIN